MKILEGHEDSCRDRQDVIDEQENDRNKEHQMERPVVTSLPCLFLFLFHRNPFLSLRPVFVEKKGLLHLSFSITASFSIHGKAYLLLSAHSCASARASSPPSACQLETKAVIAVHGLAGNDLHNGLNGEFF